MIRSVVNTILLTLLLLLPSCEKYEWEKAERIKLESQGIELLPPDTGFSYRGDLPSEGTCFSIIPEETYAKDAAVVAIVIDGIQVSEASDYTGEPPRLGTLSGAWGSMIDKSDVSPRRIEFQINENDTDKPRSIRVYIEQGYAYADLLLTQAPRTE